MKNMKNMHVKKTFILGVIMIQLEKYHGAKSRITCLKCGKPREFTRFIDTDTGEYLPDHVGICNRSSKCGYCYTAKQYFADNPKSNVTHAGQSARTKKRGTPNYAFAVKNGSQVEYKTSVTIVTPDYIALEHLAPTIGHYDQNSFVQFLFNLFPDCGEEIQSVLKRYFVGTFDDYTCFPSLDQQNRICRAKLIKFNQATGKRLKGDYDTSSLPAKLKLKENFNYKQIFFGEHLLFQNNKPIAIVEAEKTAIIASLCFPEFVWLGSNSKQWLKVERLQKLGTRKIILFPDADGFDDWQIVAAAARAKGLNIAVSDLIERCATSEQKANGFDLADYLINEQNGINRTNEFIGSYNSKLEKVFNCEQLFADFETILDEQKAIIINNGLSDAEADAIVTRPENLRRIILNNY
jgi:hypothetical protein